MYRVLFFLLGLVLLALGFAWFADRPGQIVINWQGYRVETSVSVALAVVFALAVLLALGWGLVRFVFGLPSFFSLARHRRRQNKGYAALSRGMIAAGVGDAKLAAKSAIEAQKHLPAEPLALLLKAQAAQLTGQKGHAETVFKEMAERRDMRLLGLRGLHVEAQRRGDLVSAQGLAHAAYELAPLPWSAKAVLDHRTKKQDWQGALATLEKSIAAQLIDKKKGERQRAVLETAIAEEKALAAPDEALRLTRAALNRAPELVPALVLCARLLSRRGDLRKAAKLIEEVWPRVQHPDLSAVYIDLRPGDSNADRLLRAEKLARLAPYSPESKMAVASAALAAKNFAAARRALRPLVEDLEGQGQTTTPGQGSEPPSARACLLMAELEDAEKGAVGEVRQWLARSARAPRDPIWVADGFMSDHWLPASPVTGELDAFVWQRPAERLGADLEAAQKPLFSSNAPLVIDHPALPEAPGQGGLNGSQALPIESDAEDITEVDSSAGVADSEALHEIEEKPAKKLH